MRTVIICGAVMALTVATASAAEKSYHYPGDDWELDKHGTTEKQKVSDYTACLMSPSAPPVIDSRGRMSSNRKSIETHRRFVLSCMGAKGYVLVPPSAKP